MPTRLLLIDASSFRPLNIGPETEEMKESIA